VKSEDDDSVIEIVVPDSLVEMRVDRAVSMLTGRSRSEAATLIANGAVSVDGRPVTKGSMALVGGTALIIELPPEIGDEVVADESVDVRIVAVDTDFVVVDKDPGVVVHPGAGQRDHTLIAGVLARFPEISSLPEAGRGDVARPGVVHRLDKGTSGLLVIARTTTGYDSLVEQLAARTVRRRYVGLVEGHVTEERGVVDAPIGRSTRQPTLMAVRADGREARTHYRVIERLERPHASTLMELRLETGRTHQIRVHMAAIGHPIVNDPRYGHRRDRRLDAERFFLHAAELSFVHPSTGEGVTFTAALPRDLASLIDPALLERAEED
jgi:23S rRNA pseudouridine1911/1915/1917 synthase